jgi:hypothetical protein
MPGLILTHDPFPSLVWGLLGYHRQQAFNYFAMSYSRPITREQPSCLLFIIDQSGSMSESFAGTEVQKDEAVAQIVNRLIDIVGLQCIKKDTIRHYFDIGIIVYNDSAISLFTEESSTPCFRPINLLYENPINLSEVEQGRDPIWIYPQAEGLTATYSAFSLAKTLLEDWAKKNSQSYPPTVFHISDGNFSDQDPRSVAEEIKQIQTEDGSVLIFNINIAENRAKGIIFPDNTEQLPSKYACTLFEMSSILPEAIRQSFFARQRLDLSPQSRAFVFNADPSLLTMCLDIGTPINLVGE